jgi:hypothetical protein
MSDELRDFRDAFARCSPEQRAHIEEYLRESAAAVEASPAADDAFRALRALVALVRHEVDVAEAEQADADREFLRTVLDFWHGTLDGDAQALERVTADATDPALSSVQHSEGPGR